MDQCKILACQILVPSIRTRGNKFNHIRAMLMRIAVALREQQADLVVLAELSTIELRQTDIFRAI